MGFQQFDGCLVHIPHKDWSGDPRERMNYEEIERWSYRLKACSSCSCQVSRGLYILDSNTGTLSTVSRGDLTTACGTVSTTTAAMVIVHVGWEMTATAQDHTGVRLFWIECLGETVSDGQLFGGVTGVPIETAGSGMAFTLSTSRMVPSSCFSDIPNAYQIKTFQSSGGTITVNVQIEEYQSCCTCNWPFPC